MNVTMDPKQLEESVNKHIGSAVEKALGSYDVQNAVKEVICEEVAVGALREAVQEAVAKMDTDSLSTALAEQIERTATAATVRILREGFVDVVCRLRGVSEYSDEGKRRRKEIAAELAGFPTEGD